MNGDISRANWVVPVQALTHSGSEGIVRLVACRDGSVTLHLSCAGTQGTVRLGISRAAQLSTGIWEAAGISQRWPAASTTIRPHNPGCLNYPPDSEDRPVAWGVHPHRGLPPRVDCLRASAGGRSQ